MGSSIKRIRSYNEFGPTIDELDFPQQVFKLAQKSLLPLLEEDDVKNFSHVIVATTCPDRIIPSLGQQIGATNTKLFGNCQIIDLVQGCTGGVSAMIVGSQLADLNKSNVLVIGAESARKSTSIKSPIHSIFSNGSFACIIKGGGEEKGLLTYLSKQYEGLSEIITTQVGHDMVYSFFNNPSVTLLDPRSELGLKMNNQLAIKLLKKAESFYQEFITKSGEPDYIIFHQVNPKIIKHLKPLFSHNGINFIDIADEIGNCGVATVGIALDQIFDKINGKKVMVCSFGTGGIITAGLWQF